MTVKPRTAMIGALLAGSAMMAFETQTRVHGGFFALSVAFFAMAYCLYLLDIRASPLAARRGRRDRTTHGLVLHLRWEPMVARLACGVAAATLFLTYFVVDPEPSRWFGFAGGVAALLLVPDALIGLLRRPRLSVTRDGLDYRGWCVTASASWSDIMAAYAGSSYVRFSTITVTMRPAPASYRRRIRFLVIPTELPVRPHRGADVVELALPHSGFDDARAVAALISAIAHPTRCDPETLIDAWLHYLDHYPADQALDSFISEAKAIQRTRWHVLPWTVE